METSPKTAAAITEGTVATSSVFVKSPNYKTIYANQIQIAVTPIDFQISVAQGTVAGGASENEIQATIMFAPMQAKMLSMILSKVVGDYEQQFGTINVPSQPPAPASTVPATAT